MSVVTVTPGDWLPESARRRLSGMRVDWTPPDAVREFCVKAKRISPSQWSPLYRYVSDSSRPGQWRNDTNPYQVGIMDAIGTPGVERVSVLKVPQIGATECVHNCVGWKIDTDPAPILYVYPDDAQCSKNSKKRIQPMFKDSKHLQRHLTGRDEDLAAKLIQLKPTTIYLASAQSPSQLANTPVCWVVFDEVDKYQDLVGSETSAIKLGEKRATTYPDDRKYIYLSSPTSERGPIWQQVRATQVCMHYHVPCPHCDREQVMSFGRIHWDGGSQVDPNDIRTGGVWYECPHCGAAWDEYDRERALGRGHWRADSGGWDVFADLDAKATRAGMFGQTLDEILRDHLPHNIAFHVPAWVSTFISMGQIAAAFVETQQRESQVERVAALRDFANGYEGVPWKEWRQTREEDAILALRDEYDDGDVPDWADVLLLGADTQDSGFWYELRAFQRGPVLRSHGVRRGFVDSLDALEDVARNTVYTRPDGSEVPFGGGLIDAMGHRTLEVYEWCRRQSNIRPLKGEQRRDIPFGHTDMAKMPNGRVIPGGLRLWKIDTNKFKNELAAKLQTLVSDPGAWTFSRDLGSDHARHYVAEELDPKKDVWVCPSGRANHLWDCSVYVLAWAHILGLRDRKRTRKAKYQIVRES